MDTIRYSGPAHADAVATGHDLGPLFDKNERVAVVVTREAADEPDAIAVRIYFPVPENIDPEVSVVIGTGIPANRVLVVFSVTWGQGIECHIEISASKSRF
ncbi:MAG: hypothetical protein OXC97_01220 [Candidatus Dadabacteria bacterium]|nr:hypothetical protein [Candidatus Dadabacteria bacterium]